MTFVPAKRPLEPQGWLGLPFVVVAVASILLTIPIHVFDVGVPEPVLAMVPAFAWAVIRPSVLAPFLLIALGLFLDFLWGGPAGLWGLSLLAAYAVILAARPMLAGRGPLMLWAWYAGVCVLAFGVGVLLTWLRTQEVPNLFALAWQAGITILLYPFAGWLIARYEDADVRFR